MKNSILKLLPIDDIYNNGIIKLKNNFFIKIIKVEPINYNLKSYQEKEAILNSYKLFLKSCDFNFQIIIQSTKKDLDSYFLKIKNKTQNEEKIIKSISEQYIENIEKMNLENKSAIKNFYFIINEKKEKRNEEIIINKLNEKYFKIKEFIFRCGNNIYEINDKEEVIAILKKSIYLI